MKKNLFLGFIAFAALTMTSCSKDESLVNNRADNAIEFGTYLGRDAQTRARVLDKTGLQSDGFGVFAYYTDDADYDPASSTANFMYNTKVSTADWTYSPIKYWPNESTDKLSFFAYAPHSESPTVDTTGDPILTFTVGADPTSHIDLVVADATNNKNLTKQGLDEKVNFNFKHVLSRVGFKVEAVIDQTNEPDGTNPDTDNQANAIATGTTITVSEVELFGDFHTSADINLNTSVWSGQTGTTGSYALSSADFNAIATNVTTTATQLNKDSEYMMLIPTQTISIKIRVKYTVTTADTSLDGNQSVVVNDITSNDISFTFAQGKAYNFVLHLGLNSVDLSATVSDWDSASDIVVNVPMNNN